MSSINIFNIAMDMNGPPGLTHPFLVENYAWVDERLREMYYGYALTAANSDEYEAAGLLRENYAWVDNRLAEKCAMSDRDMLRLSCPAPIAWANYRVGAKLDCIEEDSESVESYIGHKRKRSESDISDYEVEAGRVIKRLRCQSPIPTGKYTYTPLSNPFCNLDCERYNHMLEAASDESYEVDSVSSLDLESGDELDFTVPYSPTSIGEFNTHFQVIPFDDEETIEAPLSIFPEHYGYQDEVHVVTEDEDDAESYYSYDSY